MSDGPRKPPVRDPGDDEVVFVPPGSSERPLPPRLRLGGPVIKTVEQRLEGLREQLEAVVLASGNTLAMQRKMALQLDGLQTVFNDRLDVFHRELALLRSTVTGDHSPRLAGVEEKVEKLTPQQKARVAAVVTAKFGAYGTGVLFIGGIVLRALAKKFPEYGQFIEGVLGMFGL